MEELDLKELFSIFWKKKIWLVMITIVFMILGAAYSYFLVKPDYKASTTLVLAKTNGKETDDMQSGNSITQTDVTLNQKLVSTYSEVVKSKTVIREVMKNLKIDDLDEEALRKEVTVTSVKDTEVIQISVTNENLLKLQMKLPMYLPKK